MEEGRVGRGGFSTSAEDGGRLFCACGFASHLSASSSYTLFDGCLGVPLDE